MRLLQDNARAHAADSTSKWLAARKVAVLGAWPARAPDLNIIENVWAELDKRIKRKEITSKPMLIQRATEEWEKLELEFVRNAVDGIPQRLNTVARSGGAAIRNNK